MLKLIIITAIVLISCGKSGKFDQSTLQKSLSGEPQNNETTLYGTGQSSEKDAAIENALANLKEKVYLSLSSSTTMQDVSTGNSVANEYKKTVKMRTPSINIPNYIVEKVDLKKGEYYAIVSVSKAKVVDLLNDNLLKMAQRIKPQIERYNLTTNLIVKVKAIQKLHAQCVEYNELERFYNSLGFSMNDPFCQKVVNEFNNFAVSNKIEIVNTNPTIYDTLSFVFAKKFTLLQKAENIITYKTSVSTTEMNGTFLSGLTIVIMQHNSEVKFEKKCIGDSVTSQANATNAAFEACLNQAKNQTFEEFFNL